MYSCTFLKKNLHELYQIICNRPALSASTAEFIPQQSWSITRPVASFRSPGRRFPGFGSDLYVKMASINCDVLRPSKEASKRDGWSFDIICIHNELSLWFRLPTRKDSDWITDPDGKVADLVRVEPKSSAVFRTRMPYISNMSFKNAKEGFWKAMCWWKNNIFF